MPNTRLPMNHAREILRLSREMKMSGRAIAQSLSLSPTTFTNPDLYEPLANET